jgi:hypothetical protein
MELTGTWIGTFTLGSSYGKVAGTVTEFTMKLSQQGHEVSGVYKDVEGQFAYPDELKISGYAQNNEVSLIVQHPKAHKIAPGKNLMPFAKRHGPKISYVGNFNEEEQCYQGDWILSSFTWRQTFGGIVPRTFVGYGTWKMSKVNE